MDLEGLYFTSDSQVIPLEVRHERKETEAYGLYRAPKEKLPSHIESLKELFDFFQCEYGRCASNVWVDANNPQGAKKVGWVFERREQYDDNRKHFIRETWVSLYRRCEHCRDGFTHAEIIKKPYNPGSE